MKGDPMPAFRFLVDTQPLNKDARAGCSNAESASKC